MENYRLVNLLKENRDCKVYLAYRQDDNTGVIVKVVNKELIDSKFDERFFHWAEVLLDLDHRNLINYLDFVCDQGQYAIVVEDSSFPSIYDLFEDGESGDRIIYRIFTQILEATAYAHSRGVLNGEFDFDKILVENNRVLIEDFGIKNVIYPSLNLSYRQDRIDIYNFYSPEQFSDSQVDHRSDIYSLGALLFALTERSLPFANVSGYEDLKNAIENTEFLQASEGNIFAKFIEKATRLNPAERYESVQQWLDEWTGLAGEFETPAAVNSFVIEQDLKEETSTYTQVPEEEQSRVKEDKILEEIKFKSKKRFTALLIIVLIILGAFLGAFFRDSAFNPLSYNFLTGKYLDRAFVIMRSPSVVDLIASSPGEYIFDLRVDIDSGDIISSNVLDYRSSILNNVQATKDDIILVGANMPNKTFSFPVFILLRSSTYEPFYLSDDNGMFLDVYVNGCDIYLLKYLYGTTSGQNKVIIENRDCALSLKSDFQLNGDMLSGLGQPKALIVVDSVIVLEFYNQDSQKVSLFAVDKAGHELWRKSYKSMPVTEATTWYNIAVNNGNIWMALITRKHKCEITTYSLDVSGNQQVALKLYPGFFVQDIDRLRVMPDGMVMLSLFNKNNYSVVYGLNQKGKILFKKRLGFLDKIRVTDFQKVKNNEIIMAGLSRSVLMTDTLDSRSMYLLKMSLPDGKIKKIPFSSAFLITDNQ